MQKLLPTLLCVGLLSCTSSPRVVAPPAAAPASVRPNFEGVTLYLRNVRVTDQGKAVRPSIAQRLRPALSDYLGRNSRFARLQQGAPPDHAAPAQTLVADVDVEVELIPGRLAKVSLSGSFCDMAGHEVLNVQTAGEGSVRKGGLRAVYGRAFQAFAEAVADQRDATLAGLLRGRSAPTGAKIKVAVLAAQSDGGVLPQVFDDYVLAAAHEMQADNIEAMGQDDIVAMLGYERQKDLLGCDDAACMSDLGGALGADLLLVIKLSPVGSDWALSGKIINTRNPRVEARATAWVQGNMRQVLQQVRPLVRKLFDQRALLAQG